MIDHFSGGAATPVMSYLISCIGSGLGLVYLVRSRHLTGAVRARWLCLAAVAIGGVGIWAMHFIAMLGFSVEGTAIRYDIPITALSAAAAVLVVGCGLFIVGLRPGGGVSRLLAGGVLTGLGVAAMHYLGMAAMYMPGMTHSYDPLLVTLSVVIAIGASTTALAAALYLPARFLLPAALIMGVAVCAMHYTAMFAVSVRPVPHAGHMADAGAGWGVPELLLPLIVGGFGLIAVLGIIAALAPSREELARADAVAAR